jgi:hypothetical protein
MTGGAAGAMGIYSSLRRGALGGAVGWGPRAKVPCVHASRARTRQYTLLVGHCGFGPLWLFRAGRRGEEFGLRAMVGCAVTIGDSPYWRMRCKTLDWAWLVQEPRTSPRCPAFGSALEGSQSKSRV